MELSPILSFIGTVLVGVLSLVGVMITNANSNKKMEQHLVTSQAVTDNKIEHLTEEVRKHNNFASKIPAMEVKIDNLTKELDTLKDEIRHMKDV